MKAKSSLIGIGILFVLILVVGTAGYVVIERWSFFDALYMTIITITTVGYGEINPLSTAGRIFSIFLIIGGVGGALYTLTTLVQYFLEGHLGTIWWRQRMENRIQQLKDHMIVCGYGRVGREVARQFQQEKVGFVIIEKDEAAAAQAQQANLLCIMGDATSPDVVKEAGVERARGIVVTSGEDAANLYITMVAKEMTPGITVVARANSRESEQRLLRLGANRVIQPHVIGGQRMALLSLRPQAVDFVDHIVAGPNVLLESVMVTEGSTLQGQNMSEARCQIAGAMLLAARKKDGSLVTHPEMITTLEVGDELLFIGTREQLSSLDGMLKTK